MISNAVLTSNPNEVPGPVQRRHLEFSPGSGRTSVTAPAAPRASPSTEASRSDEDSPYPPSDTSRLPPTSSAASPSASMINTCPHADLLASEIFDTTTPSQAVSHSQPLPRPAQPRSHDDSRPHAFPVGSLIIHEACDSCAFAQSQLDSYARGTATIASMRELQVSYDDLLERSEDLRSKYAVLHTRVKRVQGRFQKLAAQAKARRYV